MFYIIFAFLVYFRIGQFEFIRSFHLLQKVLKVILFKTVLSKESNWRRISYIFECTNLSEKRKSLLPKHLIKRSNIIKFKKCND